MAFKALILCFSGFLIQSIAGNCIRPIASAPVAISNCGGAFIVTSVGPISPSGIAVSSDLALNGELIIDGALPFLSAVAFEGSYPTSGSAAVSYGCGDGTIGITNELGNPGVSNAASSSGVGVSSVGLGVSPVGLGVNPVGLGVNPVGLGVNPVGLGVNPVGFGSYPCQRN